MLGFKYDKNGPYIEKDPNATKDYAIDFAAEGDSFLIDGDTLVSAVWTVPAGLNKVNELMHATKPKVVLSGGTLATSYLVNCRITTANGIVDDRSFRVIIKEQ